MSEPPNYSGVAIIGMAGRFPGAATASAFWNNVKNGVESITFFSDRELAAAGHDVAALRRDPSFVAARGIIERPEWFDAAFFGMTPTEAETTDPQQRLLLEVSWEALEEAGYDPSRCPFPIGVYAGVATNTYYLNFLLARPDVLKSIGPMQAMIGREKDFVATRVSYKLNLTGPAINVNAACSTSLVAVCQAVQALLTYQCDMALAGGATVMMPQETGYHTEDEGITSPDGHTRSFDAEASGTTFSNGVGMVVLKRLEDAVADGDHVYAVIKGAALNNDGGDKASFMAPSAKGHAEVIAMAHALAGIDARSIGYVEAHGTATPIGDPIEVAGLTNAFRVSTSDTGFCALGSVKSNVGHLEIAAGVAGLIKAAYALSDRLLPASLHFTRPNPRIDWAASPFYVNHALTEWTSSGPRRAGVSSFGIGGTNAHVVLEESPELEPSSPTSGAELLVLSARTPEALARASANLASHLRAHTDLNLSDVAFTLQRGRRQFLCRRAVVVTTTADAAAQLLQQHTALPAVDSRPVVLACLDGRSTADILRAARDLEAHGVAPAVITGQGRGVFAAMSLAGVITDDHARALDQACEHTSPDALSRTLTSMPLAAPERSVVLGDTGRVLTRAEASQPDVWLEAFRSHGALKMTEVMGRSNFAVLALGSLGSTRPQRLQVPGDAVVIEADSDRPSVLLALGALWSAGCDVTWTSVPPRRGRRRVSLPTYPFERKRFMVDPLGQTQPAPTEMPQSPAWTVVPLAADSPDALAERTDQVAARLRQSPDSLLRDFAIELGQRRPTPRYRRAIVTTGSADAARRATSDAVSDRIMSPAGGAMTRSVVFMFPGGGAQYPSAGFGLYRDWPGFRRVVDMCCAALDASVAAEVSRLITIDPTAVSNLDREAADRPSIGLPLLFAVEVGLLEVWRELGVSPVALAGHSLGEYTAAYAAGVLSLEDAIGLVAERGRLFEQLDSGSMLAVPASPRELSRYLPGLDIAAVNGPASCVLSGPADVVSRAAAALQADDIDAVPLHINVAAHSVMVEPIMRAFGERVRRARFNPPTVPFVSNVTGDWITVAQATDPDYWVQHLRHTVRFSDGIETLCQLANPLFLEVGPGRALSSLLKGHPALAGDVAIVQSSRHPNDARPDAEVLASAVARLWVSGVDVTWTVANQATSTIVHTPASTSDVPHASEAGTTERGKDRPSAVTTPVATAPDLAPRRDRIAAAIRAVLRDVGGVDVSTLSDDTSFVELGFDSLSLTQVAQAVRRTFNVRLKFRQLLEAIPTIDALASHIDAALPPEVGPPPASAARARDQHPAAPDATASIEAQLARMAEQLNALQAAVKAGGAPTESVVLPAPAEMESRPATAGGRFGPYAPPDKKRRELTPEQERALSAFVARYSARTRGSKTLTDTQRPFLADARAVTGFKAQWKEIVYQIAMSRSIGSRMIDVDGNEYVDFTMNFGASLFGHSPSFLNEAVEQQLHAGIEVGTLSPLAATVAQALARLTGMDRVAFANTGTDAIMGALRAARTITGRDKVITFRGGYHGMNDEVLAQAQKGGADPVVVPAVPGVPANAVGSVVVLDYEDANVLDHLRAHLPDAAAVLIEPVQSRRPGFDASPLFGPIRDMTRQAGVAMIFDELITGFRLHPRGAQGWFGIDVDVATYGKILGNGVPVAAIAGRAEFMEAFDGGVWRFGDDSQPEGNVTFYGGTHTRHPLGLAAAAAVLGELERRGPSLQAELNARTAAFAGRINALLERRGVSIRLDHAGSMFLFRFPSESDPGRGRGSFESSGGTLERLLFYYLRDKGIHIWDRPAFLSTAHTDGDLDRFVDALDTSIVEMLEAGFVTSVSSQQPASDGHAITSAPAAGTVPLTAGQKEIWLAAALGRESSLAFNQCVTVELTEAVDVASLSTALDSFITRHEALRMVFSPHGEWQRVQPTLPLPLRVIDVEGAGEAPVRAQVEAAIDEEATTTFDLEAGPLCRFVLVRGSTGLNVLVFNAHHIICDGWSVTTFVEELGPLYRAARLRQPHALPPANRFSDWAQEMSSADVHDDEAYWLAQFEREVSALDLPTDRSRPPVRSYRAGTSITRATGAPVEALRKTSAEAGTTMFVGVLSSYALLLHTLSGQTDLVIGCAAAGQSLLDNTTLVGHCVSLLPVRLRVESATPVGEFIAHVRRQVLEAFDHQNYTYGQLIERLRVRRDASRAPVLSTLITYEVDADQSQFGPIGVKVEAYPRRYCNFEIELHVRASKDHLLVWLYYHPDLFDSATVDRWSTYLVRLMDEMGRDPQRAVGRLPVMSDSEQHRVLVEWNQTTAAPAALVLERIGARVTEAPDVIAVEDERGGRLTRLELARRSDRLAAHLVTQGVVGPVGVAVERSVDMVVAVLGVLKAGGAYVPLDASLPASRLEAMVTDAGVHTIVAGQTLAPELARTGATVRVLEDAIQSGQGDTVALPAIAATSTAYVLFTSGSTGRPKGVTVTHANLANLVDSIAREPGFGAGDTLLAVTTLSFDVATAELMLPLVTGGRLFVAGRETTADGNRLKALIARVDPTLMHPTPATWRLLLEAGWAGSPRLIIGSTGEALPRDLADKLLSKGRALWNLYGPTETTIWSTIHKVEPGHGLVAIGRPIANTSTYVLNDALLPVPAGVRGELFIGGAGVATGYLNRADLTAERFLPDPFSLLPGARMYRTGDRARFRSDGTLECLERLDHQVKLRGFRIELGDVESALLACPQVRSAVVVLREDVLGDPKLIGYVTPETVDGRAVRQFARERLPEYMVPSVIVPLAALPQTPSGKVDRSVLPVPPSPLAPMSTSAQPRTPLEAALVNIWQEVLAVKPVGIHANFFELGGHSLLAVRLVGRIKEQLGREVAFGALLSHATVADLADLLEPGAGKAAEAGEGALTLVTLQAGGPDTPIFFVHGIDGDVWGFVELAKHLGRHRPVYGLQPIENPEEGTTVAAMAARYLREVLRVSPQGPYLLGGFCSGAAIAYEMAQQLRASGRQVGLLAAIDFSFYSTIQHPGAGGAVRDFVGNFWRWVQEDALPAGPSAIVGRLVSKVRLYRARFASSQRGSGGDVRDRLGLWRYLDHQVKMLEIYAKAMDDYRPSPYAGRVTILRARTLPLFGRQPAHDLGWGRLASDVDVNVLPGSHDTVMKRPYVEGMARAIERAIASGPHSA